MAPKGCSKRAARTTCMTTKPRKEEKNTTTPRYDDCLPFPSDTVNLSVLSDQGSCHQKEEDGSKEDDSSTGCSTPKAERYKIREIGTCPPAPKKRRPRCWRRPRSFFVSLDIEAFFLLALGGISV